MIFDWCFIGIHRFIHITKSEMCGYSLCVCCCLLLGALPFFCKRNDIVSHLTLSDTLILMKCKRTYYASVYKIHKRENIKQRVEPLGNFYCTNTQRNTN